eukprot:gene3073-1358_t
MEVSDQEEEEVEEVMEAEIVSLTLDPPPANAATVLHQHHIHHSHHGHGPNCIDHSCLNNSSKIVDNPSLALQSMKQGEVIDRESSEATNNGGANLKELNEQNSNDVSSSPKYVDEGTKFTLQPSPTEQDSQKVVPSFELGNATTLLDNSVEPIAGKSIKSEVLPKKSSFSCLKSRKLGTGDEQNKTRKNVSFPADGIMVTMKVDPVDPWRNAKVATSAEVIFEYKKICKQTRTKVVENVVRQLQDLPDLSTRIATLSLKGVKLDSKSCEALEAVFKRVRFEVIDFENCGLEEEGATALLEMIEFYQSACKLSVAMNPKMGARGWQTLCRMLRKTPCLHSLDARRTMLTDQTMPMFGRCLKMDPHLRTLHLEGVFLSGRPLLILTTALKYNTFLEDLYLGDNDLQSADGVSIGTMLSANKTLQLLDLRNNSFRDAGLVHIANGLTDQANFDSGGLASIVLWNLGLTHEAMFGFCNALAKSKSLRSLNLGQNRLSDLGIQKIKPGLIRNRSLRKLGLLNTRISNEGAVALAEILADSISLSRIDVRENNIQIAGLMAVSLALKVNHSLIRIDLDKELKKEPGLETVQQSVLADIYNFCHRNKQLARETISRESSTSEDSESLVSQEFSEKESDDERSDNLDDFSRNQQILSTLQTLASKERQKQDDPPSHATVAPNHATVAPSHATVAPSTIYKPTLADAHKNSVTPKPRFTITRLVETIGNASAGVANKIASVRSDHSAKSPQNQDTKPPESKDPSHLANDGRKDSPWKNLQRQTGIDAAEGLQNDEEATPTVDFSNTDRDLGELYRRLQDGKVDIIQDQFTENSRAIIENKVDNHIEKMQFPGKAKKLNDVIRDKRTEVDGSSLDDKSTTNDLTGIETTGNFSGNTNGQVGIE